MWWNDPGHTEMEFMNRLKVAMIAPAWLTVPASGYGGTEAMIHMLCRGLREAGVHVELFTVKGATAPATRYHWTYREEQYPHLKKMIYDAAAIPAAHILGAIERIKQSGNFDVIHDHNVIFGPSLLSGRHDLPPVLHTLHQAFCDRERMAQGWVDTAPMYNVLAKSNRLHFNGISRSQISEAPWALRLRIMGAIHHGIDPAEHPVITEKQDYFVNVGRLDSEKGIAIAAKACAELGVAFRMAGVVAGINDPERLRVELNNPRTALAQYPDFEYFRDEVAPYLKPGQIEYVGSVVGAAKDQLIGRAKAFLMPIQWEEPFGVAVIDALVCGTPVVAMRRGSMAEIIEHGVNGFLADTPEQFRQYMARVDEIDPMACRRSVEQRFSYRIMTQQYLSAYQRLVALHAVKRPSLVPRTVSAAKDFVFYEGLPSFGSEIEPLEE
jgi:glycosyltransferase involved in cell wall biosynthesis